MDKTLSISKSNKSERSRWNTLIYWIHIIGSLAICSYIYALLRPSDVGLQQLLALFCGDAFKTYKSMCWVPVLGEWVIYSMPAMLWTFSLSLLGVVLGIDRRRRCWLIALIPLGLTLGLELLQYCNYTDGTFDSMDIVAGVLGYLCAVLFVRLYQTPATVSGGLSMRRLVFSLLFCMVYVGDVWGW